METRLLREGGRGKGERTEVEANYGEEETDTSELDTAS